MPLAHVNGSVHENAQGVHFPMMHGHAIVRVVVTRAALQGLARPPEDNAYLERFEVIREFFEILARDKFDPARPLSKIIITREDLLGKVGERQNLQSDRP